MDADEYTALGGRLDMAQIDGWYGRFEDIEIDPTFLCLTDLYAAAAPLVPADWTVVDLGGYVGVQAGLFAGRYVDVDCYDLCGGADYTPPRRYRAGNAVHVVSDIASWLGANPRLPRRTLLLMSGVPRYERFMDGLRARGGDWAVCIRGNPPKGMALGLRHRRREAGRMTAGMETDYVGECIDGQIEAAEGLLPDSGFNPDDPDTCALLSIAHSLPALAAEGRMRG